MLESVSNSKSSLQVLIVLAFAVLALAGCPRPPVEFGPRPFDEAEQVLEAVRERQLAPKAFIAEARVRIDGPAGRGSADHFIVVRRPADLRLETLSFFGNPIALVVVFEGSFILWEIDANRAWQGEATAENLSSFLPIDLEPEAVVGLLSGLPPILDGERRLDLDHERRRYVISIRSTDGWQQLVVHPSDYTIEEVNWFDLSNNVRSRLFYDRYRAATGETAFPYEIRYQGTEGVTLRVLYRDLTFDPAPDELEGLFGLRVPDQVQLIPVDGAIPQFQIPAVDDE